MAAIQRQHKLEDNPTENEISQIAEIWNNHNSGILTWSRILATNSSSAPLVINNSTGTNDIAQFQDNGANALVIADGGASTFTARGAASVAVTVNNGTSTGAPLIVQDNGATFASFLDGGGLQITTAAPATPTANTLYADNVPKAWVSFNGSGTVAINDDFNVTSITDNGVGSYAINWDLDFANANYIAVGTSSSDQTFVNTTQTTASNAIFTSDAAGALNDAIRICCVAFGDQ